MDGRLKNASHVRGRRNKFCDHVEVASCPDKTRSSHRSESGRRRPFRKLFGWHDNLTSFPRKEDRFVSARFVAQDKQI